MASPGTAPSTPSSADSNFQDDLLEDEPSPIGGRGELFDSSPFQEDGEGVRSDLVQGGEMDAMDTQPTGDAITPSQNEAVQTTSHSSQQMGKGIVPPEAAPEGIDVGSWISVTAAGGKKQPLLDEELVKTWNTRYAGIVDRLAYPSASPLEQSQQVNTAHS